jgi:hypothetical protein
MGHWVMGWWMMGCWMMRWGMMRRWAAPVLVLLPICAGGPAIAGERGPVCREPSVVDEMTRQIRDHNYYSLVNPRLVTETPTVDANLVRCQVCVQSAPYDTIRFGDRPIRQCLYHGFDVQILSNGFVVRDLR